MWIYDLTGAKNDVELKFSLEQGDYKTYLLSFRDGIYQHENATKSSKWVVNISSDINKPVFPALLLQIEMYRVRNNQVSWLC